MVSDQGGRSRPLVISQTGRKLLVSAVSAWRSAQVKAKQLLGEEGVAAIVGVADSIPLDELVEEAAIVLCIQQEAQPMLYMQHPA